MSNALRQGARACAPRPLLDAYLRLKMMRDARRLVSLRERHGDAHEWIDELLGSHFFRLLQKKSEVLRLHEMVRALRPVTICEIGAAGGGTAFLFASAACSGATIVSVDLKFDEARRRAVRRFARRGQTMVCVEGDSHSVATLDAVRRNLKGRPLDLLYLDGDHSYQGVAADFRMYAPLVRKGGLVVLHDIVPDYRTRYGTPTRSDTGDVPRFWRELSGGAHSVVETIVEDEEQDGFGIGVLRWTGCPSTAQDASDVQS